MKRDNFGVKFTSVMVCALVLVVAGAAYAAVGDPKQIVTVQIPNATVSLNDTVPVTSVYGHEDNYGVAAFSYRVHFKKAKLQFATGSDVPAYTYGYSTVNTPARVQDEGTTAGDDDGDPETDAYVIVSYGDATTAVNADWPYPSADGRYPINNNLTLLTFNFTVIGGTGTTTKLNVTALNYDVDYHDFQGNGVAAINIAAGPAPVLGVTPANQDVASAAASTTFTVQNTGTGDLTWNAAAAAADTWITSVTPANGTLAASATATITVAYQENTTAAQRIGTVNVTSNGGNTGVTVTQAAPAPPVPVLAVAPGDRPVNANAGSTTFTVQNTGTGTLTWNAATTDAWLTTINPNTGSLTAGASATVTVTYEANTTASARKGFINFTSNGGNSSPSVSQAAPAPVLGVTPADRPVTAPAGNTTFTVQNTGTGTLTWDATTTDAWLTITKNDTGNGGTINVAYAANDTAGARVGTIAVTSNGGNQSVTVTQALVPAIKGDADGNGVVSIFDALETARYVLDNTHPLNLANANVNCDAAVTMDDARIISRVDVQLQTFPTCGVK